MASLTRQQRDTLVKTILGEARGEGAEGMAAVAHVIANRAASGQYPSDPARVALQPYQFSTWNRGEGGNNPGQFRPGTRQYNQAAQIIDQVFGGQSRDPTNGALFYHTPQVRPNWSGSVNRYGTTQIGNHIFYNGNPVPPRDIPNAVASRLDVTPPQTRNVPLPRPRPATRPVISATTPSQPTSMASRAFPTNNVTPRLAPDGGSYQYNDRTMQPAQMVGGLGSLTPNATPSRAAPVRTATPDPYRGIYPVQQQTRLPSLPPPSTAAPRPTLNQMRADTGQLRATPAPNLISASMERAAAATNPTLQAALRGPAARPASRDAQTQAASGAASAQQLAALFNAPRAIVQPTSAQVNAGTGFRVTPPATQPATAPKLQDRLTPGVYPASPTPVPAASPITVTPPRQPIAMPVARPVPVTPTVATPAPMPMALPRPQPVVTPAPVAMPAPSSSMATPIAAAPRPIMPLGWAANFGGGSSRGPSAPRSLSGGSRGYSINGLTKRRG